MLHEQFCVERIGGEWFEPCDALLDWIEDLADYEEPNHGSG